MKNAKGLEKQISEADVQTGGLPWSLYPPPLWLSSRCLNISLSLVIYVKFHQLYVTASSF